MSDATLHDYYAARAPEYDRVYAKPERQQDLRAIEAWLPPVFLGRSVLEVACGTGYWSRFLAPVARTLVAVDAAPETLAIARARVAGAHVTFLEGDAYRLPDTGAKHDAAFAGFWLSHVPRARIPEFLAGLHAKLAPGAKVVFLDNRYVAGSSTPVSGQDAEGNTYQVRRLADGSEYRVLKNFPTAQEMAAWPGVTGARVHEWEYYWALEYALP